MSIKKKISIGTNIINGPWGGGNQFAGSLSNYLKSRGWEVVNNLKKSNIDIILMTEPRRFSKTSKFNQLHISGYVFKNPNTIVVHRINECDERKNTNYVNKYLVRANKVADFTVFISKFLMELFIKKGYFKGRQLNYIRNGADKRIFNKTARAVWDGKGDIKIVTHHWAYNYFKGFDIYFKLDKIKKINGFNIIFTYIGRIPENIIFKNIKIIGPLHGEKLAEELKKNHIYITGSINEPAGMHHIEGALCGLPLLYRNSGALPEYCDGFGVIFESEEDVEEKLVNLINNYDYYVKTLNDYPYDSDLMCKNYEELFLTLLESKNNLNSVKRRFKYLLIFLNEILLQFFEILFFKASRIKRIKEVFNGKKVF